MSTKKQISQSETELSSMYSLDSVKNELQLPSKVLIHDVTLRDGEQSPGVVFSSQERVQIARQLDSLGVHRIEAGFPIVSDEDRDGVAAVAQAGLKAEVWGFGRCLLDDVIANDDCGVKSMILEIAISEVKMRAYGIDRQKVISRMLSAVEKAKTLGMKVAFMPVDLTRSDLEFAKEIIKLAVEKGGVDEIVVVDTIGVASPELISYIANSIQEWVGVPMSVHCHNDFGLALANSIAGLKAGAECVHVSINSLGERAGNVDLAETVLALQLIYGIDMGIETSKLFETARLIEELSGFQVAFNKAVTGEMVFSRESGGVVQQLLSNPKSVEPYEPELVGQTRSVILGKKSGRYSIAYALEKLNIQADEDQITAALKIIKEQSRDQKRIIDYGELSAIINKLGD